MNSEIENMDIETEELPQVCREIAEKNGYMCVAWIDTDGDWIVYQRDADGHWA